MTSSHRIVLFPRMYSCRMTAAALMRRNFLLWLHPRTCFWMVTQALLSRSRRSFSRYATWPARKKIFVRPNLYWSGSYKDKSGTNASQVKSWCYACRTAEKPHLNHPLQHIFASLLLVVEGSFLLRHEDTVATVKLNVRPPANVAIVFIIFTNSKSMWRYDCWNLARTWTHLDG